MFTSIDQFRIYKDLCDIIDSQFEPEKGTLK